MPWAGEYSIKELVIGGVDSPMPKIAIPNSDSAADTTLAYALSATQKQDDGKKPKGKNRKTKEKKPDPDVDLKNRVVTVRDTPPEIDWSDLNSILGNIGAYFQYSEYLQTRVQMIGFSREQNEAIATQLSFMTTSKQCAEAFRAANLPTPAERIKQYPLIIAHADLVTGKNQPYDKSLTQGFCGKLFQFPPPASFLWRSK